MEKTEFYKKQSKLIEISFEILSKGFQDLKENPEYKDLFYGKNLPAHIAQPLEQLKQKIKLKPFREKIVKETKLTNLQVKSLIGVYGLTHIMRNLEKIKSLLKKYSFRKIVKSLNELE